jgi:hypothetical protein
VIFEDWKGVEYGVVKDTETNWKIEIERLKTFCIDNGKSTPYDERPHLSVGVVPQIRNGARCPPPASLFG